MAGGLLDEALHLRWHTVSVHWYNTGARPAASPGPTCRPACPCYPGTASSHVQQTPLHKSVPAHELVAHALHHRHRAAVQHLVGVPRNVLSRLPQLTLSRLTPWRGGHGAPITCYFRCTSHQRAIARTICTPGSKAHIQSTNWHTMKPCT
jgi:hypothetical protein